MKKDHKSVKIIFYVFLLWAFFLPQKAVANVETSLNGVLISYFSDFGSACRSCRMSLAVNALKKIETWKLDQGLRNAPSLSQALLRLYESSPLYKENSNLQRLSIDRIICRISPDEPTYQWKVFKRHLIAKPFDIYHLFKRFHKVGAAIKTNLGWSLSRGGELILSFIAALFLTGFCFSLNLIIKYSSHLIFYMKRFLRFPINNVLAVLLILIVFFLPVYFNIGFAWLPIFWMVLMWMILSKFEKGVVLLLALLFLAASPGFKYVGHIFSAESNRKAYQLYLANYAILDPVGYHHLKREAVSSKKDAESLFTLGLLAKRRGNYREAIAYYQAALKAEPDFSECMNNLANVYLLMRGSMPNAVNLARTWYKKAIGIRPDQAIYFYNLSKSFPLLQVEGMEYIVKARDLAPELIDKLTRVNSDHPNQMLVDCLLPKERIWRRAFSPGGSPKTLSLLFWRFFLHTPLDNTFFMPIIFLFLIIVFSVIQGKVEMAASCARCGQMFFRTIPIHYNQSLCHQCQMLQERKEQADPDLVKNKENEIIRFQRIEKLKAILVALLPAGGSFVLRGKPFLGLVMSFLFFWFLSYYLVSQQVFSKMAIYFFGYSNHSLLSIALAIIIYLICLVPIALNFTRGEA